MGTYYYRYPVELKSEHHQLAVPTAHLRIKLKRLYPVQPSDSQLPEHLNACDNLT